MSIMSSAAGNPSRTGRPSWRAAVWCIDTLLHRPPVVLGLAAAVAAAVFVLATPRVLPMLGGLVATIAIGAAGPWLSLVGLRGRLDFAADRCRVGDRVAYQTVITRFGWAALPPRVDWPAGAGRDVAAGVVVPTRRGLVPRPGRGPAIASDWPFGITTARRPLEVPDRLVVRPVTTPVRFPIGFVAARSPGRDSSTGLSGTSGDVQGVREFRPGDSVRSIHWSQTARRGSLVVCERPGSAAVRVRIRLVAEGGAAALENDPAAESRLDAAVAVASSLLESWSARGADLEVVWAWPDGTEAVYRPRNRHGLDEALDALACLEKVGPWPGCSSQSASSCSPILSVPPNNAASCRFVDLEIQLAVRLDRGHGTRPARPSASARLIKVAFEPVALPGAIALPASGAAAAALDRAFVEISHDPDAR